MARICVLSPHPDDAVWSVGGWLAKLGKRHAVVVVTVFDGDPPPSRGEALLRPDEAWRSFGPPSRRREDDRRAVDTLACQRAGLGFVDAALRPAHPEYDSSFRYATLERLFERGPVAEAGLIAAVADAIAGFMRPDDITLAPLALGRHVDHRIVREVVLRLRPRTVAWYEEFPYARDLSPTDIRTTARETAGNDARAVMMDADIDQWMRAALCYRGELIRLFGGREVFKSRLSAHACDGRSRPSVRIWWTARS